MKSVYKNLFQNHSNHLGYGFTHYFFSCLGQTFFISVFVDYFVENLDLTNDSFSFIYAFATISSAFLLPFVGAIIDKVKIRYFSLANGLTLSLFCILISFASNSIVLYFALLGLRLCGQGLMPLTGSTSIARFFDKERGLAISLSSIGLSLSETIMPGIAILLITQFGWESAWQILAVGVWVIFIPIVSSVVSKNDPFQLEVKNKESKKGNGKDKSRKEVLRDKRFFLILPAAVFIPFFITGIFIHHNLLADIKGWTMEWIATCFIGYGIFKMTTSFFAGALVDYFSARKIYPLHMFPLMIGVLLLITGDSKIITLIYLCLAGMSTSLMSISSTAMWTEVYGFKHLGAIKSMVTTLVVFSSALGPVVLGYFLKSELLWSYSLVASVIMMFLLSIVAGIALNGFERPTFRKR